MATFVVPDLNDFLELPGWMKYMIFITAMLAIDALVPLKVALNSVIQTLGGIIGVDITFTHLFIFSLLSIPLVVMSWLSGSRPHGQ